jgi:hypothetical protein
VKLAKAVAVGSPTVRKGVCDHHDERSQQSGRGERPPPGRQREQQGRRDGDLEQRQQQATRAGEAGRDAEVLQRAARAGEVQELGGARRGEHAREHQTQREH